MLPKVQLPTNSSEKQLRKTARDQKTFDQLEKISSHLVF